MTADKGKTISRGIWVVIWREGSYLDLWSVNHTLFGVLAAWPVALLHLDFGLSLFYTTIAMFGWEIYELSRGVKEAPGNKVMDVVTGVLGFLLMDYILRSHNAFDYWYWFPILLGITAILEIWGFWAYKRRDKKDK